MPLPASFLKDGFQPASEIRKRRFLPGLKRPGIMIGTEGQTNTGKTEFGLSAPGPGIALCVDRGFDGVLDNPNPPKSRNADFAFDVTAAPLATQTNQNTYLEYWRAFYERYKKALENLDSKTVLLDGDSDSWELQRLATFGKLTQIPPIMYTDVNAARRAMIARAWDSGKIIIATNKIKDEYVDKTDAKGDTVMGNDGKPTRVKSGNFVRQGFEDQDYLWQIQLRHLYRASGVNKVTGKEIPQSWGIRILKCKPNPPLQGIELWGSDCNFASLVQVVYPHVELSEWGL